MIKENCIIRRRAPGLNKVVHCVKIVFILRMKLEIVLKKDFCLNEISTYEILVVIVEQF